MPSPMLVKLRGVGTAERKADRAVVAITVTTTDRNKSDAAVAVFQAIRALHNEIRTYAKPEAAKALDAEGAAPLAPAGVNAERLKAYEAEMKANQTDPYKTAEVYSRFMKAGENEKAEDAADRAADAAAEREAEALEQARTTAEAAKEAKVQVRLASFGQRFHTDEKEKEYYDNWCQSARAAEASTTHKAEKAAAEAQAATKAVDAMYCYPSAPVVTEWHESPVSTSTITVSRARVRTDDEKVPVTTATYKSSRPQQHPQQQAPEEKKARAPLERRYRAIAYVTVTFRDLDRMGEFLNAVATGRRHCHSQPHAIKYLLSDWPADSTGKAPEKTSSKDAAYCQTDGVKRVVSSEAEQAMRAEAVGMAFEDARRQAEAIAQAMGKKSVVPVMLQNEGDPKWTVKEAGKGDKAAGEPLSRTVSVACEVQFHIE